MNEYCYDLHVHTSEASRCAHAPAAEIADFYKSKGYQGIVITDHFFNGNCSVLRELPWEEKVDLYCMGYENAKKRGDEIGLDVFFGWEFSNHGADFLTFGLDRAWLLAHPDVDKMEITEYFDLVHADGGFISHAHPFADARYIRSIQLYPKYEDAVEVCNAPRAAFVNRMAAEYARNYKLNTTGGSDCHNTDWTHFSGVALDFRADSLSALIDAIRAKKHRIFFRVEEIQEGET